MSEIKSTFRPKLIEVALPLEAINAASAREKSIRHGHPSTLHLWWARRPLAACRAVLFAQLVDDPSSWPDRFPTEEAQGAERKRLHDFIAELVKWENSNDERTLNQARWYIARSLAWGRGEEPPGEDDPAAVRRYLLDQAPPVYDPFCGGGSIPLEAQRLGLRAYASDLNPVAVMISKALVEFPPKFAGLPPVNPEARRKLANGGVWNAKGAQGLADDVRYYGRWMRDEAYQRIGDLYPEVELRDGSKATVIAWLWARTVASPNPACKGAHVPLVSSFMLSTKTGKEARVEPVLDPAARDGYRFEVRASGADAATLAKARKGTKSSRGANFVCVLTGTPITPAHVKAESASNCMDARLMAIVAEGRRGRVFLPPNNEHERRAANVNPTWKPEQQISQHPQYMGVAHYGFRHFSELFTSRQLMTLGTLSDLISTVQENARRDAADANLSSTESTLYADAIALYLTFGVSKQADYCSNVCIWRSDPKNLGVGHVFARQAIPMIWDYCEGNPFSASSGNWLQHIEWMSRCLETWYHGAPGKISQADASRAEPFCGIVVSTDPPYYDNVPYADLSDFFYIWMRRSLNKIFPAEFSTVLTPKSTELVADRQRFGTKDSAEHFFLDGMSRSISKLVFASSPEIPIAVYYAFKQAEVEKGSVASTGWATFLQALMKTGLQVDGTWPIRTELGNRTRNIGSNALASSIVLVCRKRQPDAPSVTRGEFLRALRAELPGALHTLQEAAIAPVDMAQASIGPGMAVFSRYKEVLEADDTPMSVREALRIINAELDEYLARQEGDYDSRTRFALTWFQQHGFSSGPFGDANTIANARDVSVEGVAKAGVLESKGGKVRLLRRDELPEDWDPWADRSLTVWEGTQHVIRRLEGEGEDSAARLVKRLGPDADMTEKLAYRLYQICERKGWAEEARAYNGLVVAWPALVSIASTLPDETTAGPAQAELAI
jgi:putative DNA methylase